MPPPESRRLTGPNLFSHRPGAVLDAPLGDGEPFAGALIDAWRREVRRMLDALGWGDQELAVRRHRGGASLYLSAPIDGLYAATEVLDWAWEAALREAGAAGAAGGTAAADFAAASTRLRAAAAHERDPALAAMREAAAAHGVSLLSDDEQVTVGLGAGSRSWRRGELPPPAAVDWASVHDIPVALVTGTNGKTTTVRLAAAMLAAAGHTTGVASTDSIAVGPAVLDAGDYSGPGGARTLLRDRRVEVAVLETARGGLLRRGLALGRVAAAAVTNIAADHLGDYGIDDLAGLAETKLLVTRAVARDGRAVLNADDPELAARGTRGPSPVTWTSLEPWHPLAAHLAAGGDAVLLEDDRLVLARGTAEREVVAAVGAIPIAFGGAARYNLANAQAAIGLAAALGTPVEAMARGLAAVRGGDADGGSVGAAADDTGDAGPSNPGRGYLMEIAGFRALVDYAHNPHGLGALIGFASTLPAERRLVLLGHAGDRDDEAIRELARTAWRFRPDRVILKEMPSLLRGRPPREIPALLEAELLRLGARRGDLAYAPTELDAVRQALAWARPGDLLLLLVHTQREEAMAALRRRRDG